MITRIEQMKEEFLMKNIVSGHFILSSSGAVYICMHVHVCACVCKFGQLDTVPISSHSLKRKGTNAVYEKMLKIN
jgi:hypothetical protein